MALVAALLCATFLVACGGSDDSAEPAETTTAAGNGAQGAPAGEDAGQPGEGSGSEDGSARPNPAPEKDYDDSGGGSGQFRVEGGDNSIQDFGRETTGDEFDAAAAALHGFLDARVAREWGKACAYMAQTIVDSLQQLTQQSKQLRGANCAKTFGEMTSGVPASGLREAAVADVGSFRVDGKQGFLIYRGAADTVFAMPMAREGSAWKIGALAGTPLN